MIKSVTKDVAVGASSENTEDIITGKAGKRITIKQIAMEVNASVDLRGYIDGLRVVDASGDADCHASLMVPVEAELAEGEVFKAGWNDRSGSGATASLTVYYEELSV